MWFGRIFEGEIRSVKPRMNRLRCHSCHLYFQTSSSSDRARTMTWCCTERPLCMFIWSWTLNIGLLCGYGCHIVFCGNPLYFRIKCTPYFVTVYPYNLIRNILVHVCVNLVHFDWLKDNSINASNIFQNLHWHKQDYRRSCHNRHNSSRDEASVFTKTTILCLFIHI